MIAPQRLRFVVLDLDLDLDLGLVWSALHFPV
jgi:hypothetical protein